MSGVLLPSTPEEVEIDTEEGAADDADVDDWELDDWELGMNDDDDDEWSLDDVAGGAAAVPFDFSPVSASDGDIEGADPFAAFDAEEPREPAPAPLDVAIATEVCTPPCRACRHAHTHRGRVRAVS